MGVYLAKRLLLTIPTLLLVTVLLFLLVRLIPGDIIAMMSEERGSYSEITQDVIRQSLGLDMPVHVQYGRWLGVLPNIDGSFSGIFQGDLGDSLWTRMPVIDQIVDRLPITLELGFLAILVLLIISLPIGIYSAIRQDSKGDYVSRSLATLLIALPNFWVGLMIVLFASVWFGMSPPLRPLSFIGDPIANLKQFITPAIVLGMAPSGVTIRMTRSMMLEVLRQDYIRTAWAKGLKERIVITRHALKNAFIPVITIIGLVMPVMIGGTVIIETVFNLPGMGRLLVEAVFTRDYPMVSGVVFVITLALLLINLAVDLTYGFLDPRVRYK